MRTRLLFALIAVGLAMLVTACSSPTPRGDVNDFSFESFHGHYTLSLDADGRSLLRTVETLVALFPDYDQNRGIRRELVEDYDGHPTDLRVISVTDESGTPRHFEADSEDGFTTLTIADDRFVHGRQTYVITYEQRNVTRHFADTGRDEFYWDTNGTGWRQPFGSVSATVALVGDLAERTTGHVAAYRGVHGSNEGAEWRETPDGFEFLARELGPRENLTFAIGFEPGTFVERDSGFFGAPWPLIQALSTVVALVSLVLAIALRSTSLRSDPGRPFIVAEYLPPRGVSVLLAADVLRRTSRATTAMLLDLAVSGRLRIIEESKRRYRLELVSIDGLGAEEVAFVRAIFGPSAAPGSSKRLRSSDDRAAREVRRVMQRVHRRVVSDGWAKNLEGSRRGLVLLLALVGGAGALMFGILSMEAVVGGDLPGVLLIATILVTIITVVLLSHRPLSSKGAELRDHLRGLRLYISLAEADRIAYLQSPGGASRDRIDSGDPGELIRLNERLLPYAVLFGLERQWAAELGRYYEQTGESPTWYSGTTAFSAGVFASSIGSVSSSLSSSFSSSSGGSSGGGSSGGGGGGGGGGGV